MNAPDPHRHDPSAGLAEFVSRGMMSPMRTIPDRWKGAVLATLGGIGWGVSGSVGQILFTAEGMSSRWLVPVRLGLAGILLLAWEFLNHGRKTIAPWKTRRDRIDLLIYGIAGVSMCQYFYFRTIELSDAAIGTILQDLSPVFILIASSAVLHKLPSVFEYAAVALALAGVFFLSTHGDIRHLAIDSKALLTGILSAVCVTIYNVYPRRLLSSFPLTVLQGWAFLLGALFFIPVFQPARYYVPLSVTGLLGIAVVVLIGNIFSFLCYMEGVKRIGPKRSILYGFSEPASAALITVLLFHQPFSSYDVLGFFLIFASIALISFSPEEKQPESIDHQLPE